MRNIYPELNERLTTLISSMGYELVGCEVLSRGRQTVLQILIDSENGVSSGDCAKVSRQVGAMLDVEDAFQNKYTLEVSSPGIDRPLYELGHFIKYVGKRVKVRLSQPIENRRQFNGLLKKVDGEDIYLILDETEQEVKLPFAAIDKANLVGEINM